MIITSFSEKGYEEYGRRFIKGFLDYWEDEPLTVYVEGTACREKINQEFDPHNLVKLIVVDLLDDPDFVQFAKLLEKSDPLYRGCMRNPQTGEEMYNFRYDAHKFFRKVFAITAYDQEQSYFCAPPEPFAWLDADIVFYKKLPENFLVDLLAGHAVAYLGRSNMYTETGFIAWDPRRG